MAVNKKERRKTAVWGRGRNKLEQCEKTQIDWSKITVLGLNRTYNTRVTLFLSSEEGCFLQLEKLWLTFMRLSNTVGRCLNLVKYAWHQNLHNCLCVSVCVSVWGKFSVLSLAATLKNCCRSSYLRSPLLLFPWPWVGSLCLCERPLTSRGLGPALHHPRATLKKSRERKEFGSRLLIIWKAQHLSLCQMFLLVEPSFECNAKCKQATSSSRKSLFMN